MAINVATWNMNHIKRAPRGSGESPRHASMDRLLKGMCSDLKQGINRSKIGDWVRAEASGLEVKCRSFYGKRISRLIDKDGRPRRFFSREGKT